MKNFVKILVVSMLILAMTLSFASCNLFGLDLDKVEERLEDEDYVVDTVTNEYYILVQLNTLFPYVELDSMPEEIFGATKSKEIRDDKFSVEMFYAMKFESKDAAKEAYAILEPELEYFVEEYNENADTNNLEKKDFTWKRDGDIVYFGTVDAVKTALGMPFSLLVFAK